MTGWSARVAALAVVLPMLAGCGTQKLIDGEPSFNTRLLLPAKSDVSLNSVQAARESGAWQTGLDPDRLPKSCTDMEALPPGPTNFTMLRRCFYGLKSIIDDQYREYKITLRHASDAGNTFADLATLGLNTAGTATGGAAAKTLLSAIAVAIGSAKSVVSADMLYKQSIAVSINQMDADRASIESRMVTRLNAKNSNYTIEEAMNDLLEYFDAGTFTHALVSLGNKIAVNEAKCRTQANNVKVAGAAGDGTAPDATSTSSGCPSTDGGSGDGSAKGAGKPPAKAEPAAGAAAGAGAAKAVTRSVSDLMVDRLPL